jgi:hypothetical protein
MMITNSNNNHFQDPHTGSEYPEVSLEPKNYSHSISSRCLICGMLNDGQFTDQYHDSGEPLICLECRKQDMVVKCTCGHLHEAPLMIQCGACFHWQHGPCENIHVLNDIPELYICSWCNQKLITNAIPYPDLSV